MSLRNRLLQLALVVLSLACGIQAQDNQHCSNATMHEAMVSTLPEKGSLRSVVSSLTAMVSRRKTFRKSTRHEYWASRNCRNLFGRPRLHHDRRLGGGNVHVSAIVDQGKGTSS